jgi:phenylpropionate dioxygenase-like ring-hydroxylating dioxygenase large terminal subunit
MAMTSIAHELLAPCLAPFSQSSTLPSEAYTHWSVFRWEMEHFFDRSWVCVGRSERLRNAGDQRAVKAGLESAVITRDEDGELRAFHNVCRHRGHELLAVGESTNRKFIRCPYHAWAYELDGDLKGRRALAGTQASTGRITRSYLCASSIGTDGCS